MPDIKAHESLAYEQGLRLGRTVVNAERENLLLKQARQNAALAFLHAAVRASATHAIRAAESALEDEETNFDEYDRVRLLQLQGVRLEDKDKPFVVKSAPSEHVNCPLLVGHLNKLSGGTDEQKALAMQLLMILDDVEAIASLIDHDFPAERLALARTQNIAECAKRLQSLIVDVTYQATT